MSADGTVYTAKAMHDFRTGVHLNSMLAQLSPTGYKLTRWFSLKHGMKRRKTADQFTGMARYQTVQRLKRSPHSPDIFSFFQIADAGETEKENAAVTLPELVAEWTSLLNADKC